MSENALRHVKKNDGEFWTELKDFIKYYEGVVIGSVAPDFDKDGCSETLRMFTFITLNPLNSADQIQRFCIQCRSR